MSQNMNDEDSNAITTKTKTKTRSTTTHSSLDFLPYKHVSEKTASEENSKKHTTENSQNLHIHINKDYPENTLKQQGFFQKMKSIMPPISRLRKTIKASFALLIGLIFVLNMKTRAAVGNAVLLHAIVTIFFFPVRTIGIEIEAVVLGVTGGLIGAAWSFLGSYLASLARNPLDPNPIQPGACSILAVFLFLGAFVLNLIRINIPKANFGCVIACIILSFSFTYAAAYFDFTPSIVWMFLKPVASAGAVCLAVNIFIWPDDSVSNFIGVTRNTLAAYNAFFKEHTEAFLSAEKSTIDTPALQSLKSRLRHSVLLMIECKRAVKRELLFSRISDVDCVDLTALIVDMRHALHGIGLGLVLKNEYANTEKNNIFFKNFNKHHIIDAFNTSIKNISPIIQELSKACVTSIEQVSIRIGNLHYHPRTGFNSLLWPFPRLWVSKIKPEGSLPEGSSNLVTSSQIREIISRFDSNTKDERVFQKFLNMNSADIPRNGPLYLIFHYIYHFKKHATDVALLLEMIEKFENERVRARFWLPHQTLKKWIMSNSNVGDDIGQETAKFDEQCGNNDIVRIDTRLEDAGIPVDQSLNEKKPSSKNLRTVGDPDVSAPVTLSHKVFHRLYLIGKWFTDTNTLFSLKAAISVVLLAIPAYRTEDHDWYMNWRGQWAMITAVLWTFPMTGAFIIGLVYRVGGSVIGSVLGIVVWEITRGNPYGLAVLCFFVYMPLYHVFFFYPKFRVISLMSKVTMILVIAYEYNYVVDNVPNHDEIYSVAGKRLLLIIIGIAAAGVMAIVPYASTGRVALRKKIGITVRDIGQCFGILCAATATISEKRISPTINKSFQELAIKLRRQVAEEHSLLDLTRYEPPLRGYFPQESYTILVNKIDNMSDLVANMGYALNDIRPEWRAHIASILLNERKEYLSSILTSLKLISSTLIAKTTLPPYMISPVESRQKFINLLDKKLMIDTNDIIDPSFPSYSSYTMNSLVFVDELQSILKVTEELVGVEDPRSWLLSQA